MIKLDGEQIPIVFYTGVMQSSSLYEFFLLLLFMKYIEKFIYSQSQMEIYLEHMFIFFKINVLSTYTSQPRHARLMWHTPVNLGKSTCFPFCIIFKVKRTLHVNDLSSLQNGKKIMLLHLLN